MNQENQAVEDSDIKFMPPFSTARRKFALLFPYLTIWAVNMLPSSAACSELRLDIKTSNQENL